MRSRFSDHDRDEDERSRPTRFWGGAEGARESEASGSIGDEGLERYEDRYRGDRFREYPGPMQSSREAERYYDRSRDEYGRESRGVGMQGRRQEEGPYARRPPEWPVRGYEAQEYAGNAADSYGGAWPGREARPYGYYGQDRGGGGIQSSGHRGKGPKGYERTDERLRELICERLTDDDSIDAREVSVNVASGRVTLEGTVDSRRTKYDIEECAEQCGAREIVNNLRIERNAGSNTGSVASSTGDGNWQGTSSNPKEGRSSSKGH